MQVSRGEGGGHDTQPFSKQEPPNVGEILLVSCRLCCQAMILCIHLQGHCMMTQRTFVNSR